jgi:hypothetical protein
MSPILAPSAEDLMRPGFVPGAAMARQEILVLTQTYLPISEGSERRQQILSDDWRNRK